MTKIEPMTKAARAKPGRKPKPEEDKAVKKTVSLKPATYKGLLALEKGGLSQSIESLYEASLKRRKRVT